MAYRVKPKVDFVPKPQIEAEADRLLDDYESKFGPIAEPPIPVDLIAEDLLGFQISSYKFGRKDVVAFVHPDAMEICLNLERSEYLDKVGSEFTVAHEIGHWVLNHFVDDEIQPQLLTDNEPTKFLHRDQGNGKYSDHEFQAEYFASCLIMPKRLLLPASEQCNLLEWKSLYDLKDGFGVSITAMTKKLQEWNLIFIKDKKIYRNENEANGLHPLI